MELLTFNKKKGVGGTQRQLPKTAAPSREDSA